MTTLHAYLAVGAVVGLGILVLFALDAARAGTGNRGCSLIAGVTLGLFSVPLWPVTLAVIGCMLATERRDAREGRHGS